jgi:hypothetical protein
MIQIDATRTAPNVRLGQLADVLERFDIVPYVPPRAEARRFLPADYFDPCYDGVSRFVWRNDRDGARITLAIYMYSDADAPELIRELRMCGFVAGVTGRAA